MNPSEQRVRVAVGPAPIEIEALFAEVSRPDAGATVLFTGTVRDHSEGKEGVTHLDYEVYPEQAQMKIDEIIDDAREKWPVLSIAVEHRSGRVSLQEVSVAVAVSSAHRADAFDAARFIIDEVKARAPIWKKEFWPGGAEWSHGS